MSDKVRILQILGGGSSLGGVERMLLNYYKYIDRSQYLFDFCFIRENTFPLIQDQYGDILEDSNIYELSVFRGKSTLNGYCKGISKIKNIIRIGNYDVVHINAGRPALLIVGLIAAKQAHAKSIILHSHSTNPGLNNSRNVGYRNFHLTIQGQAVRSDEYEYYNKLKKYIKDHEADDYITLLTGVSYQEMEKLYLRNDIFILVSKNEVANVSILDAMTYGLPVICTSSNGTSDYVLPGESGYVYQAGDIEDLSSKIKKYLDDNTSIQKQGCYAKEYVKKTFGFGNYYKKLVNVIESL